MAESNGLLNRRRGNSTEGSNPSLSAIFIYIAQCKGVAMRFDTTPDTNLIQKGVSMSKRNEKYLKQDEHGVWKLVFRVPSRFGGKLIRQSLFTEDFNTAAAIRDRFVTPILAINSGIAALEEIGKSIIAAQGAAIDHLSQLKNIINGSEITLEEAYEKYLEWMKKSSDYRPGTQKKYTENMAVVIDILGANKTVGMLSKADAVHLRDKMRADGKSATTIFHVFSIFRGFLRWLNKEGLICSHYVVENFQIDLPPVRKVNTPIIPPSKADEAMTVLKDWTLIPRIQRYTGMRIGEVEACLCGYSGCGIVNVEGIQCFKITKEFCKTHVDRFVPVCDKLAPFLTKKNIAEAQKSCAKFDVGSRRNESPSQKRYNRAVKKIEGCETAKDHSWRVYAQTMMIEAGVDDLIVRRIIGHKDSSNVHYGYTAARVEAMKKALDKIP